MISLIKGQSGACALLLSLLFVHSTAGQLVGNECFGQFKKGRQDFVLDADESVKDGATFISSPKVFRYRDCVQACCKESRCNVAFMERAAEEGSISSCFLFDCLYKQKYVCRFVTRKGYDSYILDKVFDSYHVEDVSSDKDDHRPVADAGPDQVVQPQERLTLNGFHSKDDKEIVSFKWKMLTEYPHAVFEASDVYKDQMTVSNLTSGKYKFQLTVTDSIGQSDTAFVNVLVLTPEQSGHHCMSPKKVGPCRGSFPRWHYNGASEKCEQFIFGGCKENLNNYLSEDECVKACHNSERSGASGRGLHLPTPQEKCGAPCTAQQFTCDNGCCLDPGLECDLTPQCSDGSDEKSCESLTNNFEILLQIPLDEKNVHCTELPETGDCRDSITKWYYDPYDRKCLRFNYGGCKGNANRFDDETSCMAYCRGITENDVFIRLKHEAQSSDSQTGILAIAIVLGVAIVIVVAILSYCFLKKRKSSQHQRLPVSNTTHPSMDTDRLVYNSTTKPI